MNRTKTAAEVRYTPADFASGLARLRPQKGSPRSTHIIDLSGDGFLCRPNQEFESWAPAAVGVTEADCQRCLARAATMPDIY